ncbi:MAG: hypothetical protein AAF236_01075 [Verrucomicrobiota bacterium]
MPVDVAVGELVDGSAERLAPDDLPEDFFPEPDLEDLPFGLVLAADFDSGLDWSFGEAGGAESLASFSDSSSTMV